MTSDHSSGDNFSIGTTAVTYHAGSSVVGSFDVIVKGKLCMSLKKAGTWQTYVAPSYKCCFEGLYFL